MPNLGRGYLYRILNLPAVYALVQHIVAPGHIGVLTRKLRALTEAQDELTPMLDIGCGPESWLYRAGCQPYGIDITAKYVGRFVKNGGSGVVGDASRLPFANSSFGSVWSIGLFHHMPDQAVRDCLASALKLCRAGGHVFVMDAVMPRNSFLRPIAYAIRKLDRGGFMRTEQQLAELVPAGIDFTLKRFTYAATGLEVALIDMTAPGQPVESTSASAATT